MWEIDNLSQLTGFFRSVLLGCIYCIIYDFFRAGRKVYKSRTLSVFIQDLCFSLMCAFSCFCFLLAVTNGELRAYILFGIFLGFCICRLTFSRLLFYIFKKIWGFLKRIFSRIGIVLNVFFRKTEIFLRNRANTLKKLLKKARGLLYTKHKRKAA